MNINKCPCCKTNPIFHTDIITVSEHRVYLVCPSCGIRSCTIPIGTNIERDKEQVIRLWNMYINKK